MAQRARPLQFSNPEGHLLFRAMPLVARNDGIGEDFRDNQPNRATKYRRNYDRRPPRRQRFDWPVVDAMKTALPENETERLNALRRYQILDTPPEPAFDRVAEMASNFFQVPMAGVSLVDEDRVWFKSRLGISAEQTARDAGLCSSAMLSEGIYHLRDAAHDERAFGHSFVADLGIRFYAAAPLRTHEGFDLGTVWVLDQKPRALAAGEAEMLRALAALAMNQMELRLYAEKVSRLERTERTMGEQLREANQRLAQSEERFRDFFEEAPIAYVVGSDAGIIRANRAAARILGVKPEEITELHWRSLFPDSSEAQRRLREALKLVESRTDACGVDLELRRKEDSRPLWIQWWSKREEGGKYARVMFLDITDRVLMEREKSRLEAENAYLLNEIRTEQNFGDIIGGSSGLRKVTQQVQLVAPTDATVLITGESGTGKELVARAIHERSARRERPLVKLNCSAVPDGLFESEFFGHVKGAFTGALKDKPGRFELADGGTLFLDEIGEVPLAMQAKLLRVLQEQELERVGDTRTRKVNVRVIAASNRDLKKEVDEGRFRQDLFYRLSVFPIEVAPLRERREDIGPLAAHFIRQSARRMNRTEPQISKTALDQLGSYDWPGNVRELQNTIERAIILWREDPLTFDLPPTRSAEIPGERARSGNAALLTREELKRKEREAIINALKQTNGRVSGSRGAAELLGMKPSTLASRISSLAINRRTLS
jgi:formate hydrogenlyase transcriptional activator